MEVTDLGRTVAGDWNGADSIVTGPKARVVAYGGERYREVEATIEPGTRVFQLADRAGAFEKVESMRVTCTA